MPLSGRINLRYSLSHQQRVNASIVSNLSSFARNGKVGQPFHYEYVSCQSYHSTLNVVQYFQSLLFFNNDNKDKTFLANGIPQSCHSSIIPKSIIATTKWIHHFRVSTVVYHNVESTVRFGWCFEQAVPFHFSQYNDRFFYGHTFITNSSKVQRRVRKAKKQTGFASQTSNCPTLSG